MALIECPECGNHISTSPMILLKNRSIKCEECGLALFIDAYESKAAIDSLAHHWPKIEKSMAEVQTAKSFNPNLD